MRNFLLSSTNASGLPYQAFGALGIPEAERVRRANAEILRAFLRGDTHRLRDGSFDILTREGLVNIAVNQK